MEGIPELRGSPAHCGWNPRAMKRRRTFDVMEHTRLEEKTPSRRRRLADAVSTSSLLLGGVAVATGLAHVILKRWPASDCGSSHSQMLGRLQDVAFYLPILVLVLGVGALIARTGSKGRACIGMTLALLTVAAVLGGFECSVSTP